MGGGSLATGGGGMALGATALNVVTIGPAILVSGLMVAGQGEKAQTKARENEAEVNIAIAEMKVAKVKFDAIRGRAKELERLLAELMERGATALNILESEPFEPSRHASHFQSALTLALAIRDIASTAVVDDFGVLNEGAATLTLKYRPLIEEDENE